MKIGDRDATPSGEEVWWLPSAGISGPSPSSRPWRPGRLKVVAAVATAVAVIGGLTATVSLAAAPAPASAAAKTATAKTTIAKTTTAKTSSVSSKGTTTTKPPATATAAGGRTCAVIYEIESEWPSNGHRAFQGDIQIVNLTPRTLTSWTLGWTFPNDQVVYQHWGTDLDQHGQKIVATSEPNEGYLGPNGGRFHLGFLANVTSTNALPTSFTFNGATCPLVDDKLVPVKPAPPTVKPAVSCQAIYEIETSWPTSTGRAFLGDVQLVNTSAQPLTTWSFGWTFGGNQSVYQSWGADFRQKGQRITADSEPNEGYVGAKGGRFHLGFLANYTGANAVPTGFTVNGTPCTLIKG
ncbi:MAG TPA: cellulose binding domain-containing protein [Kineosporiaceae bacterium]